MSVDRFRRLDELFRRARALDARERREFLERECASDTDLRNELEGLLHEHDRPGTLLESDGAGAPDARPAPARVGRYRVLRELGHGGMGTVYLARQEGTEREVALKLIRGAEFTPSIRRRFEFEAQALGRLRHIGIAQVYDAGLHNDGRGPCPYLAMEYVAGPPLDEYLRARSPDPRVRLALFALISDAVHHAHLHGIIHRDLKPANILIEEGADGPRPKLVDFGIARATDADLARTLRTVPGQLLGTARYMSPEQTEGDGSAIDARSDIFALGTLLHEMLAGQSPFAIADRPLHDVIRAIREDEPTRLGTMDRTFRGPIETIALRALEKAPERRYQSAAELAEDVRRALRGEPIAAVAPTTLDQLRRLVRRHRTAAALIGALATVLAAGVAATGWQAIEASRARRDEEAARVRAERRFEDLRGLANVFLFELDPKLAPLAGSLAARELVVRTGLTYLDRLAADADGSPDLERELAAGYIRLGDIQGGRWSSNLGDTAGAEASYRKAVNLLNRPAHTALPESAVMLLRAEVAHADTLFELNRLGDAVDEYGAAEAIARTRRSASPTSRLALTDLASVLTKRAIAVRVGGDADGSTSLLDESDAILDELVDRKGSDPELVRARAINDFHRAIALLSSDPATARERLESYLERVASLRRVDPQNIAYCRDEVVGRERLGGLLLALGDVPAATSHLESARVAAEEMVAASPDDATALGSVSASCIRLGELALEDGATDTARLRFERAYAVATRRAELDRLNAAAQRELGVTQYKLGELERAVARATDAGPLRSARFSLAARWFERCAETFRAMEAAGILAQGDAAVFDDIAEQVRSCTDPDGDSTVADNE